jgi:phosphate transport system substrate-binding protein
VGIFSFYNLIKSYNKKAKTLEENSMRGKIIIIAWVVIAFFVFGSIVFNSTAEAKERLRISCSAQIYEALEKEMIPEFKQATGIEIDLYIGSSYISVKRLIDGTCDIASSAGKLSKKDKKKGCVETPFCKDPLAIIINSKIDIDSISERQLKKIFNRNISNWKEIGGPDHPITVIVPGKSTAAYNNFSSKVMKRKRISYDFMTYRSTFAIEAVKHFPYAISFTSQGAALKHKDIKTLKINGLSTKDKKYPYYQQFSYITIGKPAGKARALLDFISSEKGKAIMKKEGVCLSCVD